MQECPFTIDTSNRDNQGIINFSYNQFVNRILTVKSGWTPYVYYTMLYTMPCYTAFMRIYWAHFLEK